MVSFNVKEENMISLKPAKGHLMIAEPSIIGDNSFNRSVVLIAENDISGYIGFILNKPLEYTIRDLIPEISSDIKIYKGGPVEQDNLYFIHKVPDLIPESIEISSGIYWGGDFETVSALLRNNQLNENDIRFFLGYSGWQVDQLEQELSTNSWIVVKNEYENKIIEKSSPSFWNEKMRELGGDYLIWSNAPDDPGLN